MLRGVLILFTVPCALSTKTAFFNVFLQSWNKLCLFKSMFQERCHRSKLSTPLSPFFSALMYATSSQVLCTFLFWNTSTIHVTTFFPLFTNFSPMKAFSSYSTAVHAPTLDWEWSTAYTLVPVCHMACHLHLFLNLCSGFNSFQHSQNF